MEKQPVDWEDCCVEYWCAKTRKHTSRWTGRRDMTEKLIKTALNPNQSINQCPGFHTTFFPSNWVPSHIDYLVWQKGYRIIFQIVTRIVFFHSIYYWVYCLRKNQITWLQEYARSTAALASFHYFWTHIKNPAHSSLWTRQGHLVTSSHVHSMNAGWYFVTLIHWLNIDASHIAFDQSLERKNEWPIRGLNPGWIAFLVTDWAIETRLARLKTCIVMMIGRTLTSV